jgi:hypothetical protein
MHFHTPTSRNEGVVARLVPCFAIVEEAGVDVVVVEVGVIVAAPWKRSWRRPTWSSWWWKPTSLLRRGGGRRGAHGGRRRAARHEDGGGTKGKKRRCYSNKPPHTVPPWH